MEQKLAGVGAATGRGGPAVRTSTDDVSGVTTMHRTAPHRTAPRRRSLTAALAACAGLIIGALTGAGATSAAAATTLSYYVSPTGSGQACTTAAPCTLTTAQQLVRSATATAQGDIDVVLAGGTYRLASTLSFSAAAGDGATSGHTVTYRAAAGATPVLSGGWQLTSWTQGANGVWQTGVPAGTDTRQLYVNGVRANRAAGAVPTTLTRTATGYTAASNVFTTWSNISDVEFVYNVAWTQVRCGIASVSGTTVTMDQPCFDNSTKKQYGVNADLPSSVENAKPLLTQPGQWYLDRSTNTVYYLPREGQDMSTADVEIPRLQTLVSGTGTEQQPLNGLAFSGISFEYGGWTAPDGSDGFSEVQANMRLTGQNAWQNEGTCTRYSTTSPGTCPYGAWTMTPGNVVFDHTTGLSITGSTFEHLGAAGLQLGQDADGSTIQGNTFTDISGNGLEIGNGTDADPTDLALLPANNTVADNWIHNIAVEYTGGVGIFQGYTRYDTIEHNQVNDVPYSGISSNWGWGRTPTETKGNQILDNLVYDQMQQRSDGGGIYVLGQEGDSLADGLLISGNVVRNTDSANGGHAIYTDGGSEYITMTGNAMYANNTPSMGGCEEGTGTPYGEFSFTGNYVENTTPDWPCGTPTDATISNTQVSPDGTGVPASLIANAGLEPQYASLAQAPAGQAQTNLALGKPVQAQFLDGSTAALQSYSQLSYATDGNPASYVQASGQFRWQLVVDLQAQQSLGRVTVTMPQAHFATAFHVDASTDGSSWTTVGTVTDSGWGTIPVVFTGAVSARYLRIVADAPTDWNQRGDQMAIAEVGAFAPTSGQPDLALGRPAQALYIDGTQAQMQPNSTPSLADDGNTATSAQATGQYRWIQQIDLTQPQSVDVVSLQQPDTAFATNWHIDVSLDGSTYWTVARHADTAGGRSGVQLAAPVTARYIRLVADLPNQGGQTGGQMAVSELGVYSG
ncbi:discoidin domain-containing protein [Streptacidiphilus sp. N1-10]|uniref:Discoidin domain-containing protein n=1 Tax=Streptacidiphilus jeojiensis TaxID=3229225 RepID=A0ABV6XFZ8_9ACTN